MFAAMYGASLSGSFGLTWNCWTMPGKIIPSRIADSASIAMPIDGQQPRAPPDVEEEQQRADERDAGEDLLGRQHGVVVGVVHAGDQRARAGEQVEAVEPVVGGLGEHEDAEQHREVHLRGPQSRSCATDSRMPPYR